MHTFMSIDPLKPVLKESDRHFLIPLLQHTIFTSAMRDGAGRTCLSDFFMSTLEDVTGPVTVKGARIQHEQARERS